MPSRVLLPLVLIGVSLLPASANAGASAASTYELVEAAVDAGELDRVTADRYLMEALRGEAIPARYRGEGAWDGTLPLLEITDRVRRMPAGEDRAELRSMLTASADPGDQCAGHAAQGSWSSHETTYFHIDYHSIEGGLTEVDYGAALDQSWQREIVEYGWAPALTKRPGGKYHVVVSETLSPNVYGLTADSGSFAGFVGDNPATPWNEGDADASCIVLNDDYSPFPGAAQEAMEATAAHELVHAIQFGYGALSGTNVPDPVFIEGHPTWMEDEVFDDSNDNQNYLWPNISDDMGDHDGTSYRYWIVWRAIAERFGTGVPGGGEDVYQRFWEITSRNEADTLAALDLALRAEGVSLENAYHAAAIALGVTHPCGGGYAPPHCLEEAAEYVALKGEPPHQGSIHGIGSSFSGSLPDNYSTSWIDLPTGAGTAQLVLNNRSQGGSFRASAVCDTGAGLRIVPFTSEAASGEEVYARSFDTSCVQAVAVVTNLAQTEANPDDSINRAFQLSMTPLARRTRIKVKPRAVDDQVHVEGRLRPKQRGAKVEITLYAREEGEWDRVRHRNLRLRKGRRFEADLPRPDAVRCRLDVSFPGDEDALPSEAARAFPC